MDNINGKKESSFLRPGRLNGFKKETNNKYRLMFKLIENE